jgi:hypothetical protein
MMVLHWDPPKKQCDGEEKERARRMVRYLKSIKKTGTQISIDTGICKGTSQRYVNDPPGLPSRMALKKLEAVYGEK